MSICEVSTLSLLKQVKILLNVLSKRAALWVRNILMRLCVVSLVCVEAYMTLICIAGNYEVRNFQLFFIPKGQTWINNSWHMLDHWQYPKNLKMWRWDLLSRMTVDTVKITIWGWANFIYSSVLSLIRDILGKGWEAATFQQAPSYAIL